MANRYKIGFIIFLVFFGVGSTYALQWPVWPDSTNHHVSAVYGLIQGDHLHTGIDIAVPAGNPVYAVESGYVKAIITLYGNFSSWRMAICDSANESECNGWMYAHVAQSSFAFEVGDWVNQGDSIGTVVNWPEQPETVQHLHFSKIRFAGDSATWYNGFWDWEFIGNPLEYLDGIYDTDFPVIDLAWYGQLFAFCRNGQVNYFMPGEPISGDVDIISSMYDCYNFYQWKNIPYKIEYKIEGDSSIPWTTTVCFTEPIGSYNTWMQTYRSIIYQDDFFCNSNFGVDSQVMFFNLTNTDGDGIVEVEDMNESWRTTNFYNGEYTVYARASDFAGNATIDSMIVTVANFFAVTGTVDFSDGNPYLEGTTIEVTPDGQVDSTDASGEYIIDSVGGGYQTITISRIGYESFDTSLIMSQNLQLDITLVPGGYICGDVNNDLMVNIFDITFTISFLYLDGPAPYPGNAADVNNDGTINIFDITTLINNLYMEGPPLNCP